MELRPAAIPRPRGFRMHGVGCAEPSCLNDPRTRLINHHGGVILLDGCLYGAAHQRNGGRWICLAWNDGAKKYAEKGVGKGSLTCADGMLYCWSENGLVGLVPATPEKHEPVSRFTVASGGDGPTWAHPVVCGGRLYLRHGNVLHAYDIRAEK